MDEDNLEYFLGIMDIPIRACCQHNSDIAEVLMGLCLLPLLGSIVYVMLIYKIIDIAVACDGTLSMRGYTVTYGVVIIIPWETGQVLNFEIKCKRCSACTRK